MASELLSLWSHLIGWAAMSHSARLHVLGLLIALGGFTPLQLSLSLICFLFSFLFPPHIPILYFFLLSTSLHFLSPHSSPSQSLQLFSSHFMKHDDARTKRSFSFRLRSQCEVWNAVLSDNSTVFIIANDIWSPNSKLKPHTNLSIFTFSIKEG